MTTIKPEDVKRISNLAKIEVADENLDKTSGELTKIISWMEKLNELEVDDVEPLNNIHNMSLRMEDDVVSDGDKSDDVLKNASDTQKYNYFTVPKVLDQ